MRTGLRAIGFAAAIWSSGSCHAQQNTAVDAERDDLIRSLTTACRQFDGDAHWAELDRCNRRWFKTHEEAVWRLHLSPHATPSSGPPS